MPRKPRIEYEGAVYHVMCRGNGGDAIFWNDKDRELFIDTLEEACGRCGWRIHACKRRLKSAAGGGPKVQHFSR